MGVEKRGFMYVNAHRTAASICLGKVTCLGRLLLTARTDSRRAGGVREAVDSAREEEGAEVSGAEGVEAVRERHKDFDRGEGRLVGVEEFTLRKKKANTTMVMRMV